VKGEREELAHLACDRKERLGAFLVSVIYVCDLQSRERGRMRVPLEGPPTRMTPFVTGMLNVRVWDQGCAGEVECVAG
jgi:hypothetical protein